MSKRILVVEDEQSIARLLLDYCRHAGYEPTLSLDEQEILSTVERGMVDVLLLDLMLPGMDGLDLCQRIRRISNVPILIISARVDEVDRLLGLELGADDYICKPFSPREVIARVKAILRRQQTGPGRGNGLELDPTRLQVTWHGRTLTLTTVEFALLDALAERPGQILSRQQLMDRIYTDQRVVSDRTIDSHVKKLRQKLGETFPDTRFIESVYGAGYRLDVRPMDE